MGKIVRLTLLNKLSVGDASTDDTTAEDTVLVAASVLPPRVSVGIVASEGFRCLIFEVVVAIVVVLVNDRFGGLPAPLVFEGKESAALA
jgi:hypothetical protein